MKQILALTLEGGTVVDRVCERDKRSGGCAREREGIGRRRESGAQPKRQTSSAIYGGKPELLYCSYSSTRQAETVVFFVKLV